MAVIRYIKAAGDAKLALHDLGGSGPPLLILHCNGIHGLAYTPLAEALGSSFHCWALDQRGHGSSAHAALLPVEGAELGQGARRLPAEALWPQLDLLVSDVLAAADWLRYEDASVRVFGHSLGGLAALAAEARQPGTFAAMYLFEPVVHSREVGQQAGGDMLSTLALRRRTRFDSKSAAVTSWASKPPFSNFDRRSLELYAEHGLRQLPEGGVVLVTDAPRVEAWIYLLIEPLIVHTFEALPGVQCPLTLACGSGGSPTDTVHAMMPAAAARLPNGRLQRFDGLHHFGPLERPGCIARDILAFFRQEGALRPAGSGPKLSHSKL